MGTFIRSVYIFVWIFVGLSVGSPSQAQGTGSISGIVVLEENGEPVRGTLVLLVELGVTATTNDEGRFEFQAVPMGDYHLLAQRQHLTTERQSVSIAAGETGEVNFDLELSPVHESVTVTVGAGGETTALEAFNSVTSLDSVDLIKNMSGRLGEILAEEPGVANRSFGAGASRPIIRGFDGDRVLIMQDGIGTGDLSHSSGDHGTSLDPAGLERLEVVKGPATLLYGSNAIGGVVNAVTPHESFVRTKPEGLRGQVTVDGGTADNQAGVNGQFQYGKENWGVFGGGSGRRTDDYDSPEGRVVNSDSRLANGRVGVGYYAERAYVSFGYQFEDSRYGVPFGGELEAPGEGLLIDLDIARQTARVDLGLRSLENRFVDTLRVAFNYVDHSQDEFAIEDGRETLGTAFDNKTFVIRAEAEQDQTARLKGKFGMWANFRDFTSSGEEALAPPTKRDAFAAFAYEELRVGTAARLQFGVRLEVNDYQPDARVEDEGGQGGGEVADDLELPEALSRSFTGLSGSVGLHVDLGSNTALVANFTRSYRAPALEELYNFGPDAGSLTFVIGDSNLGREASLGLDFSVRNQSRWLQGSIDFYYYAIDDFVFQAFTDEFIGGFRVAPALQANSRFTGVDGKAVFHFHRYLWLDLGAGYVNAKLTDTDEPLPRIPPFHGSIGLDASYKGLSVKPELVLTADQDRVFGDETPTAGYTVLNVTGSYTLARGHIAHIFAARGYNLTNELYRNHTSFIKDFAPEIGRGVKVSYSLRVF